MKFEPTSKLDSFALQDHTFTRYWRQQQPFCLLSFRRQCRHWDLSLLSIRAMGNRKQTKRPRTKFMWLWAHAEDKDRLLHYSIKIFKEKWFFNEMTFWKWMNEKNKRIRDCSKKNNLSWQGEKLNVGTCQFNDALALRLLPNQHQSFLFTLKMNASLVRVSIS